MGKGHMSFIFIIFSLCFLFIKHYGTPFGISFEQYDVIINRNHIKKKNTKVKELTFEGVRSVNSCTLSIDILVQFVNSKDNLKLQQNFYNFLLSLVWKTECFVKVYIIAGKDDRTISENIFRKIQENFTLITFPQRVYLDVISLSRQLVHVIKPMQELFSSPANPYYQKPLFFIPVALHRILPQNLSKIIMFDIDLQLRHDIQDLFKLFYQMSSTQIIGLAHEQQPVYHHITWKYREKHKSTKIGAPLPHGKPGFNSGVKLMNLTAMRNNMLYNSYLDRPVNLVSLANKYHFRGHLGDQDFFSLLSFDHMNLFYSLSCQWNRQLCEWWRHNGYKDIFDSYYNCTPPYHILHGNCGTPIPS